MPGFIESNNCTDAWFCLIQQVYIFLVLINSTTVLIPGFMESSNCINCAHCLVLLNPTIVLIVLLNSTTTVTIITNAIYISLDLSGTNYPFAHESEHTICYVRIVVGLIGLVVSGYMLHCILFLIILL